MSFKDLPEEWGLQHTYVFPTYAQSNDKAEAALKKVKKLLKKSEVESHGSMNDGFCGKEMLARNTSPFLCEESCSILGRILRGFLPRLPNLKEELLQKNRFFYDNSKRDATKANVSEYILNSSLNHAAW